MNVRVERLDVAVLELPVEGSGESDGTARWDATTMVLVQCRAGGLTGIGYTYAHAAAAKLVESMLAPCVKDHDAMAIAAAHGRMEVAVRNQGREGLAAAAIAAVDVAMWDLKARLLGISLARLLGLARSEVPVYASGGFTSTHGAALEREVSEYRARGIRRVKIKIGRDPAEDWQRVREAREAVGPGVALMVDANGAYDRKEALHMAELFAEQEVVWFEEPVSSDDLAGLRLLRDRAPACMSIAAGEYGYTDVYFKRMLDAGAVDVLQVDATRCMGISGFLRADALCAAEGLRLSSHCAPTLHAYASTGASRFLHLEHFRDHVRMEARVFEGGPELRDGALQIDLKKPGLGVEVRREALQQLSA